MGHAASEPPLLPANVSYLVTGATGLIGKALVERLLARVGARVFVLVRARARHQPTLTTWAATAAARGGALQVLEGDVTRPELGLAAPLPFAPGELDHVFHAAGYYALDGDPTRLDQVNRLGTQHVLEFLQRAGFRGVLHHLSSVGVGGDLEGELREDELARGQGFASAYLKSKYDAEQLVRAAAESLRVRVYRPSAVVGHSITGAMDRVDGPYYLFGPVRRLRDALPRWISLPARVRGQINMVPVDYVAAAIDVIAHKPGLDGQTFHVVDPDPPAAHETVNLIADAAGASRIRKPGPLRALIPTDMLGQLGAVRRARHNLLRDLGVPPAVLDSYNPKIRYSTQNLARALAGTGVRCPPQARYIPALWDFWLRNLDPRRDRQDQLRAALRGKLVLITGASSGIGEVLARKCGAAGARVVAVARREPELAAVTAAIREAGGDARYLVADLSDMDECDRVIAETRREHGPVDVLVNNAARSIRRPAIESLARFHDYERVMRLNFFAPARLVRGVIGDMRERGGGHIINVLTSGLAMPTPRFSAYAASKAALAQFGDTLASEVLDEGVEVTGIYLPWVRTPMMDATGAYKDTRAMTPEAAADRILDAILERPRHVMDAETRRRAILNTLLPVHMSRLLNTLYRIYADKADERPEFATDRLLLKRFVKGRPM